MWQKQGCGHWSWCHWCYLQGREGISEQGKRDPSGRAKDGQRIAEINWCVWKPPQVWWFRMAAPLPSTTMLESLRESLWPSPPWLNIPVIVFFSPKDLWVLKYIDCCVCELWGFFWSKHFAALMRSSWHRVGWGSHHCPPTHNASGEHGGVFYLKNCLLLFTETVIHVY